MAKLRSRIPPLAAGHLHQPAHFPPRHSGGTGFQRTLPELAQLLRRQEVPTRAGLNGVIDSLLTAQHVTEMYRRKLAGWRSPPLSGPSLQPSTKMLSLARKLDAPEK